MLARSNSKKSIKNLGIAEEALLSVSEDGYLRNNVTSVNLDLLNKRFKCSDVAPMIQADLVRDQDLTNNERLALAQRIAGAMASSMSNVFTGDIEESELVLMVKITVVSDGCSERNERIQKVFGKGKAEGHGLAKLTASYCLFVRESGEVAFAKQAFMSEKTQTCKGSSTDKRLKLLDMGGDLLDKINAEVKFICCSRLDGWQEPAREMLLGGDSSSATFDADNSQRSCPADNRIRAKVNPADSKASPRSISLRNFKNSFGSFRSSEEGLSRSLRWGSARNSRSSRL